MSAACPYCDYVTPDDDTWQEVAHMNACHPDIVADRLRDAGMLDETAIGFPPPAVEHPFMGRFDANEVGRMLNAVTNSEGLESVGIDFEDFRVIGKVVWEAHSDLPFDTVMEILSAGLCMGVLMGREQKRREATGG